MLPCGSCWIDRVVVKERHRSISMVAIAAASLLACSSLACRGLESSPAAPSASFIVAPLPSPAPVVTLPLTGRVTETAPTRTTGIAGALVTIADGDDAGQSAVTDFYGFYTIRDLHWTGFTVHVSADGYIDTSRRFGVAANAAGDFNLPPVPKPMAHTSIGQINGTGGTCSDGVSMRACRILVFPVHNRGPIEARLTWSPDGVADLDLTLFQTGAPAAITRSAATGHGPEQLRADVEGGATYELRVTYAAGDHATTYTLHVTYPD